MQSLGAGDLSHPLVRPGGCGFGVPSGLRIHRVDLMELSHEGWKSSALTQARLLPGWGYPGPSPSAPGGWGTGIPGFGGTQGEQVLQILLRTRNV